MGEPIQEIRCTCGKLVVDNNNRAVLIENASQSRAGVDKTTFAKALEEASQGQSLISSDHTVHAVDPQGHQLEVVIHHRPSDPRRASWANVKIDACSGVQLDSLQLSQLRHAL